MSFAYFFVFPVAFGFFAGYTPAGVQMMTDIDKYLSFVLTMFIAFGLTFETPVVVVVLVRMRVVSLEKLKSIRAVRDRRRVRRRRDLHAARRDLAAACSRCRCGCSTSSGCCSRASSACRRSTRDAETQPTSLSAAARAVRPTACRSAAACATTTSTSSGLPSRTTLIARVGCRAQARRSARAVAARRASACRRSRRRRRAPGCRRGRPGRRAAMPRTSTPSVRASASACAASRVIACGSTPSQPRVTSPSLMICSSTVRASDTGIAKPMPIEPPDCEKIVLLMPIRLPAAVDQRAAGIAGIDRRVGLDEILEPVDAEVIAAERADDAERDGVAEAERIADREHDVADLQRARAVPNVIVGRFSPSAFSTARSDSGSMPRTRACISRPSASTSWMSSAPSITWWLVST